MWQETDLAYLAGIIDGEGSIYIQRRLVEGSWDYFARFQVVNTDATLIKWLHATFGGHIYEKKRSAPPPHWKPQYEWYTNRGLLDRLLPLITPYLKIKRLHAEAMSEFRSTFGVHFGSRGVPEHVNDVRIKCFERLKALNRRGVDPSPLLPSPGCPSQLERI